MDYFWLHIKKAGGQSVRELLKDTYVETKRSRPTPFIALPREEWNDALNNFRMPLGDYDFKRALFAQNYLYGKSEFDRMFKFAVIRNPYERIVSAYLYITGKSRRWQIYRLLGNQRAFLEFLKRIPEKWEAPHKAQNRHMATHTAPIVPDVTDEDGNFLMDMLLHLEYIDDEIVTLADKLGKEYNKVPHINKRVERRSYRSYYSKACLKEVEKLYERDIQRLGYDY